nr:MAG TPA: hypothetical protein [Caudoviricetes sp.]
MLNHNLHQSLNSFFKFLFLLFDGWVAVKRFATHFSLSVCSIYAYIIAIFLIIVYY